MMQVLRSALHRRWSLPTPTPLVRAGAWLIGTDPALALTSRRGVPHRLLDVGYEFAFPTFDAAILDLTRSSSLDKSG
jgi:NAD dependent epimerase/dehydratase family enzyme